VTKAEMSVKLRTTNGFVLMAVLIGGLANDTTRAASSVSKWDRFDATVTNTQTYADPYRNVTLNVTYTRPDASTVAFWGFYDGGTAWRIRFMPDQVGTWGYSASFSDGSPGAAGRFQCVTGNIPGMISSDEVNPIWFGYKGGGHVLIRSFHVGDRFFSTNWPGADRTAFLDWAQSQGYNTLSIASHYLNRAVDGRGLGWNTPDLWDNANHRTKAGEYRILEAMLDDLAARGILVFPFAGFFGKSSDFPTNLADQEFYIRYTLARLGCYWNVMLAVAGPEPLLPGDESQYQFAMGLDDISRLGNLIRSLDVFGHLLSNHNVTGANAFKDEPWESYTALQGPKTVDRGDLSSGLLAFHGAKPLLAEEVLWPGDTLGHPVYSDVDIRKNGFLIMMSAAALTFGDMNGSSSSGFSGSMDLADKIQSRHDIIKRVWDFFKVQRFYLMSPRQDLVNHGWCLADHGREYLIYLESRGTVSVTVTNGPYQVEWINAQNTQDKRAVTATTNGLNLASPPDGDDWLLHLSKPIEVWRSSFFSNNLGNPSISGNEADPDGDGIANVCEFLYGLNPTVPDAASGNLPALSQDHGNLKLQFIRRQQTGPAIWTYDFSTDLNQWSPGVAGVDYSNFTVVANSDGTETVSFRLVPAGNPRFVRVTAALR
jgi:hypothetical protein